MNKKIFLLNIWAIFSIAWLYFLFKREMEYLVFGPYLLKLTIVKHFSIVISENQIKKEKR